MTESISRCMHSGHVTDEQLQETFDKTFDKMRLLSAPIKEVHLCVLYNFPDTLGPSRLVIDARKLDSQSNASMIIQRRLKQDHLA